MHEIMQRDSEARDAILLGQHTLEAFRGYWPLQTEDTTGITDGLNTIDKYVVSTTLTDPGWQNSTIIPTDPVATAGALKARAGQGIQLTGSITLCHTLIAAGLVDRYCLWTYPYVQGRGRRLFPAGHREDLQLLEHLAFDSGVTYTRWASRKDRS